MAMLTILSPDDDEGGANAARHHGHDDHHAGDKNGDSTPSLHGAGDEWRLAWTSTRRPTSRASRSSATARARSASATPEHAASRVEISLTPGGRAEKSRVTRRSLLFARP